jgi:hypothetical protein
MPRTGYSSLDVPGLALGLKPPGPAAMHASSDQSIMAKPSALALPHGAKSANATFTPNKSRMALYGLTESFAAGARPHFLLKSNKITPFYRKVN